MGTSQFVFHFTVLNESLNVLTAENGLNFCSLLVTLPTRSWDAPVLGVNSAQKSAAILTAAIAASQWRRAQLDTERVWSDIVERYMSLG